MFLFVVRDFGLGGKLETPKQRTFPILVGHGHMIIFLLVDQLRYIHMHMDESSP